MENKILTMNSNSKYLIGILLLSFLKVNAQNIKSLDTSTNTIKLNNQKSFVKKLGETTYKNKIFESQGLLPRIECINKNGTQLLRLYFHYGGAENSVDQIEILSIDKKYKRHKKIIALEDTSFITSKKIALGKKKNDVINIFGKGYKIKREKNNIIILTYEVNKPDSPFLKRYNQYKYFINCVFKNGILIKYTFGFEYA